MPKLAKELGALEVGRLREPGLHAVGGVQGLHLQISKAGAKSWILRAMVGGKRRDMGLGPYPGVTLADARRKAREVREQAAAGVDPIRERQAAKAALIASQKAEITFDQAVERFLQTKEADWKNPKHRQQWRNTLKTYASPVIGGLVVQDVELQHVMAILSPIWKTKAETASRLRGRLEAVLDWASASQFRKGENPARWQGLLDKLLSASGKRARTKHHPAIKINELHDFILQLRDRQGTAAEALEFLILTAVRSGEVRGATWSEIDLKNRVWTIPADRMKAGRQHRVPLSTRAVEILQNQPQGEATEAVFKPPRAKFFCDMSLLAVMRRMGRKEVPHGFRSTFRDWAAERTNYPRDVCEMALAHTIESSVEAAYRRGDLLDKRFPLMDDWARFCDTKPQVGGLVVPIGVKRSNVG